MYNCFTNLFRSKWLTVVLFMAKLAVAFVFLFFLLEDF